LTPRADEAEILVVNTCSFIESAQKESIDTILEMAEHKKFGAAKKLIVAGCLVDAIVDQILAQVPEVDAVVGTGEVERILEAVHGDLRVLPAERRLFLSRFDPAHSHHFQNTPRTSKLPKLRSSCTFASSHSCAKIPQPAVRIGAARSGKSGRRWNSRNHAESARHNFLTAGFGTARRTGTIAGGAGRC